MPALPLTEAQMADAARLKAAFKRYQGELKDAGLPASQDAIAALLEFGQSALSQYLNGKIPLNAPVLVKFSKLMGVDPGYVSPTLALELKDLALQALSTTEVHHQVPDQDFRHVKGLPRLEWQDLGGQMQLEKGALVTVGTRELFPGVAPGDRVEIDPTAPIEPGRVILCKEKNSDEWRLRRVQDVGGGRWQAASADAASWAPIAYEALDVKIRVVWVHHAV